MKSHDLVLSQMRQIVQLTENDAQLDAKVTVTTEGDVPFEMVILSDSEIEDLDKQEWVSAPQGVLSAQVHGKAGSKMYVALTSEKEARARVHLEPIDAPAAAPEPASRAGINWSVVILVGVIVLAVLIFIIAKVFFKGDDSMPGSLDAAPAAAIDGGDDDLLRQIDSLPSL